jgi:hypothetical protein
MNTLKGAGVVAVAFAVAGTVVYLLQTFPGATYLILAAIFLILSWLVGQII